MPKSRFNAVRERARATRHNPVGVTRAVANEQGSEEITLATAPAPTKEEDVLPILKSLPLDSSSAVNPSEVLWALTSVTDFLSEKVSRTQVLMPQHKLIARVLFQLNSQNDYQIRDAASGCLRNMCIEAGGKTCKALEDQGCVEKCIEEIKDTAKKLRLNEEKSGDVVEKVEESEKREEESAKLLKKPKDSLNRKERRQLAKLEEAATKRNGSNGADLVMNDVMISNNNLEHLGLANKNVDEEQLLLCCSHMTNLIATVWCLVEVSPKAVVLCRRSAYILSKIFTSIVSKTRESFMSLRDTSYTFEAGALKVHDGNSDKVRLDMAMIQLATTAMNSLLTLTDSDPEFCAAIVGISKERLRHSLKTTRKALIIEGDDEEDNSLERDGLQSIQALIRANFTMKLLYFVEEPNPSTGALQRQAVSLALLSLATIRNIQSCLPDVLRNSLQFANPEQDEEEAVIWSKGGWNQKFTLGQFEMGEGLQSLIQILNNLTGEDVPELETIFETFDYINRTSSTSDKVEAEKRAEENLNNVSLALELVAELAGDQSGWCGQSGQNKQKEDMIVLDEEEEDEGNDDEMDEDEDEEDARSDVSLVSPEEREVDDKDSNIFNFDQSHISNIFKELINRILDISEQTQNGFLMPKGKDGSEFNLSIAAFLRAIEIRALSAINNICLALASFGQSPPSQPQKEDSVIKSYHNWLNQNREGERLSTCWKHFFEYASLVAALPCLSQPEDSSNLAQDSRKVMELCLCIMWSISRCFEGYDAKRSRKIMPITPSDFAIENNSNVTRAKNSLGVIHSLIAAYKTIKKTTISSPAVQDLSSTNVQLAPTPDGIRTHSLGVLSTLVRQPFVSMDDKKKIITLLVDALDVLPTATDLTSRLNSLEVRDSASMDAMVVAVNGIIDTFANEESKWDHLYGQLRLQSRLKRASLDVKSSARTIDKRKQPALRAAADEAWSNLIDFLEYRDRLVK